MSVEVEPGMLGFHHPLNRPLERTLRVRNTSLAPIAFKVKTTSPKRYAVRPNYGKVEPGRTCDISIRMLPFVDDLNPGFRCKDKFLIETTVVEPEEMSDLAEELVSQMLTSTKSSG
ncbi:PapD-like protein [Calocera cornea HHB12733]|uniref:PapD-like protein n=1 Tax=Calocera cornea HHB12733 TaxID=1353952 RepID=A0A165I8B3_9BASI|nr:PapD-like protein [Calocera cornea HHB12733]